MLWYDLVPVFAGTKTVGRFIFEVFNGYSGIHWFGATMTTEGALKVDGRIGCNMPTSA
jgi:hypothetical protein